MYNCDWILENISSFLDNELTEEEKINFISHLENCDECKKEFEEIKNLLDSLQNIEEVELPVGLHEEIMESIKQMKVNETMDNLFVLPRKKKEKTFNFNLKSYIPIITSIVALFIIILSLDGMLEYTKKDETPKIENSSIVDNFIGKKESGDDEQINYSEPEMSQNALSDEVVPFVIRGGSRTIEINDTSFSSNIVVEVENINETMGFVNSLEGYNSNSEINSDGTAYITRKIPKESYLETKELIYSIGKIESSSEYVEKITTSILDSDVRIKTLEEERYRLINLIEKTDSITNMNLLDKRVSQIDSDLNNVTATRNYDMDRVNNYQIHIILSEKGTNANKNISLFDRCKNAFISSINYTFSAIQHLVIFVATFSIPIIIVIIILIIIKIRAKKRRNPNERK